MLRQRPDLTPNTIRQAELPTSWRGYDIQATREFLDTVATVWHDVFIERTELQQRVQELEAGEERQRESERALTRALGAAGKADEELVAKAEREAEAVKAEAARELEEAHRAKERVAEHEEAARAAAEQVRAEAAADVERLREQAHANQATIGDLRERLADLFEVALGELSALESGAAEASPSEATHETSAPSILADLDSGITRETESPAQG